MNKHIALGIFYILIGVICFFVLANTHFVPHTLLPANVQPAFMKAEVEHIEKGNSRHNTDIKNVLQSLTVKILDGNNKGKEVHVLYDSQNVIQNNMKVGDTIILMQENDGTGRIQYFVSDRFRILRIVLLILGFLAVVLLIAGWKGIGSILGIIISITVIFSYILPQILNGADPLMICFYGSLIILVVTTYVAHGFSRQTTVALIATFVSLLLTVAIAKFVVSFALLSGYGSDSAYDLHFAGQRLVDMRGLLLGGIIIATVGALNDITTTQASAIFHLSKANSSLPFKELFVRGFSIGREHAISLINTLILAYAGSSLAVFIIFFYNVQNQPFWAMLNSEIISEELMKTVAGTTGLVLSMPIVTLLAALVCDKNIRLHTRDFFSSLLS